MSKVGECNAVIDNTEIAPLIHVPKELTLEDTNASLKNRGETPFFLSIRLGCDAIVKALLESQACDVEQLNFNGYKPLDLALLQVYENQKKQEWWTILEMLLKAGAEPQSVDALIYIIRSALKTQDDEFILRLIGTANKFSTSVKLHSMLLRNFRCSQPLYSGDSFSDFLESMSIFTIKLIKSSRSKDELKQLYECLPCYMYSCWQSLKRKESLYTTLVVYLTVAGWKWTDLRDLDDMDKMNPRLGQWCRSLECRPLSLLQACRIILNSYGYIIKPGEIPTYLHDYLNYADINPKSLLVPDFQFDTIKL